MVGWVGLGWVGLGWVGLGWVGLGWVGLGRFSCITKKRTSNRIHAFTILSILFVGFVNLIKTLDSVSLRLLLIESRPIKRFSVQPEPDHPLIKQLCLIQRLAYRLSDLFHTGADECFFCDHNFLRNFVCG